MYSATGKRFPHLLKEKAVDKSKLDFSLTDEEMKVSVKAVTEIASAVAKQMIQPFVTGPEVAAFIAVTGQSRELVEKSLQMSLAYTILMQACEEQALFIRSVSKPVADDIDPKKH